MNPHSSFQTKVLVSFGAAALAIAAVLGTTWKLSQDASVASQSVAHALELLHNLSQVRGDTLQIEFSTQSFRISGDEAQLVERDNTTAAREVALEAIRRLTAGYPAQHARWMRLRAVIDERIAISQRVEMLRKSEGIDAASAFVAGAPLRETRQRTYRLMQEMAEEERRSLDIRSARQRDARRHALAAGLVVTFALMGLLTASYLFIRRQLRKTEESQRALAENEDRLSTTLHSIGDAVLATDVRGCITRMNPVAERLTGWTAVEAIGRPVEEVFQIVDEATRLPGEVPVTKVLDTGEVLGLADHIALIARDGSECPIGDSAAPIRDAKGEVCGVVLVFRDVSLQRQAERTIREQNILLEQRVEERTAQLGESKEHLESVLRNVPAMIAYVDTQRRYVYANDQYRSRLAPERASLAGLSVRDVLRPERYEEATPHITAVLSGHAQSYDWEPFPGVWHSVNYVPKRGVDGAIAGYYVLGTDVTERRHAVEKIQALNAELAQRLAELQRVDRALRTLSAGNRTMLRAVDEPHLLDSMCQAIATAGGYPIAMVWYANDDPDRSMEVVAQCGYPPGLEVLRRLQPSWADNARGQGAVATAIRTGETVAVGNMLSDPNYAPWRPYLMGNASCIACPLRVNGQVIGALSIFAPEADSFGPDEVPLLCESADDLAFGIATLRARAERHKSQEAIHHLTHFDPLTGLPNETQFIESLTACMLAASKDGSPFAVLQTNIERLSEINDALGFSHGDRLLKDFARRLKETVPQASTVARLRGDEFAILMPGVDATGAVALAQCIEQALLSPFPVAEILLDVTVKTGIVLFPEHGTTQHDLFRHMDIAMHHAKQQGLHHAMFAPAQDQKKPRRLNMAGELRRAIEGGDLRVFLQPKLDMASGRVCGSEALVRWMHAEQGMIPPAQFIGLAEHTGLIKPLTEWMIEAVSQLNLAWSATPAALPIAVNLSARNLHDEGLMQKIRRWGVASGLLELEITETVVMENAEFALGVLHRLRDEGIVLYIDDFGTGYSSLGYLQKLPVDYIKIDQSFVRDMSTDKDSAVIVRSTIDLVHDLGRMVVAEGIETQATWDQLATLGCDLAQGYFIAEPMPAAEFPGWLERGGVLVPSHREFKYAQT